MKCRHSETCVPRREAGLMGCMNHSCCDDENTTSVSQQVPFHVWLEKQNQWVITLAQSNLVYQAMRLAYWSNTGGHRPSEPEASEGSVR